MKLEKISGNDFEKLIVHAAKMLNSEKKAVDALNVFPVPDGDTGTNLYMTLLAAAEETVKTDATSLGAKVEAAARGSLMGARGNSGVILSQLFRGFARALAGLETATPRDLALALEEAAKTAYKAVLRPVEGTMLTVARETAKMARQDAFNEDVIGFSCSVLAYAEDILQQTTNMLPALREAGVVDAGGAGLVVAARGAVEALTNWQKLDEVSPEELLQEDRNGTAPAAIQGIVRGTIEFRYCTEFLVIGEDLSTEEIKASLMEYGDSLLVVGDDSTVKVHIHSNNPGLVLEECLKRGALTKVQINNMEEQNRQAAQKQVKPLGVVAVVSGDGLVDIFTSLGVDLVIEGGQTMNPSTEDLVRAVDNVPAETVLILPNNGNVIFSARQVKEVTTKGVEVIPTRSIPQGLGAMLAYDPQNGASANHEAMKAAAEAIHTAELTYAVRSSQIGDLSIEAGDFIGLADGDICAAGPSLTEVGLELLSTIGPEEGDVLTIYYGQDIEEEQAQAFLKTVRDRFPDCEVELYYGGQPLYYYIMSIE